jgi:signal transduction histidine kinase
VSADEDDDLRIVVVDAGPVAGSDDAPARRGYGLIGLAERVGFAGGTLHAGPGPDGGYRVEVTLPATDDRVVT